jgi:hypothetical protein
MTEQDRPHPGLFEYPEPLPPDDLNEVGILRRREIELRILLPVLRAFARELGDDRVLEIARGVITQIAREQGAALAVAQGGCALSDFADALGPWTQGDALALDVVEQSDTRYGFDVTRCRYAEMYRRLGVPALGTLLSCGRDFSLVEGFNPLVRLRRRQTIMEGASRCDFRFAQDDGEDDAAP